MLSATHYRPATLFVAGNLHATFYELHVHNNGIYVLWVINILNYSVIHLIITMWLVFLEMLFALKLVLQVLIKINSNSAFNFDSKVSVLCIKSYIL